MHDLVHYLAQSIAKEVCCVTNDSGVSSASQGTCHLSIHRWKLLGDVDSIQLNNVKSLKMFITQNGANFDKLSPHVLKCYSLRALGFQRIKKLSSSIRHLIHLRYLNLSWGEFKILTESLCELWNLQILKLDYCQRLQKLPNSLIRLKALQLISLRGCHSLSSLPPQIGKLTSLKTLSMYVVGKKKGSLLAELGQLNLKGELHIQHMERVKSVTDAKEANMSSKHLNKLWLSWERNDEPQLQENVEQILESLQPHTQQLHCLRVGGYMGAYFPQWMSSLSLKDLTTLGLVDCKNCLHLPQLWKLPSLKYLKISNMSHVRYLCEESPDGGVAGGLLALKSLFLEKLPNLIRLSREDGDHMFPRLSTLEITVCPNLLGLPCLPSLNHLYIEGKYSQELPSSIHKLISLKFLYFLKNEELTCFPNGMLRKLASIEILDFCQNSKLELLPTEIIYLDSLQQLYITDCHSLKSLPDEVLQGLHSLKGLEILGCPKFNLPTGFRHLTRLERLVIGSISEVEEGLHEALQHMTALQSLKLSDLPNLESLPNCFGNLCLLYELGIFVCPKLTCLPTTIQRLSGLKMLRIWLP